MLEPLKVEKFNFFAKKTQRGVQTKIQKVYNFICIFKSILSFKKFG